MDVVIEMVTDSDGDYFDTVAFGRHWHKKMFKFGGKSLGDFFFKKCYDSFLSRTLVEACNEGDIGKVQKLLNEGRVSVHDTTEEGESLLSLACSAGYFELAQVNTDLTCLG